MGELIHHIMIRSAALTLLLLWSADAWKWKRTIEPKFDSLRGTEWYWNEWRSVKLQADGTFWAPSAECSEHKARGCLWSAHSGYVWIRWGDAGLHRVKLLNDGERLEGEKHDGEKCSADFMGEVYLNSGGILSSVVGYVEMLGIEPLTEAMQGGAELWDQLWAQLTYKKLKRYVNQLYVEVDRDLYQQMTYVNMRDMLGRAVKAHSPTRVWNDPAFRTVFFITGINGCFIGLLEMFHSGAVAWFALKTAQP